MDRRLPKLYICTTRSLTSAFLRVGLRFDEEIPSIISALQDDGIANFTGIPCSILVVIDLILPSSLTDGEDKIVSDPAAPAWLEEGELRAPAMLDAGEVLWGAFETGSVSVGNSGSGISSTWSRVCAQCGWEDNLTWCGYSRSRLGMQSISG